MTGTNPDSLVMKPLFTKEQLHARIVQLGEQISKDLKYEPVLIITILKGAFMFAADLVREIQAPLSIEFMGLSSYEGMSSTGQVRITQDLSVDIRGKNVIVLEDIVDTGRTLDYLIRLLKQRDPKSIRVGTLLNKPAAREVSLHIDYIGFEIENQFVVGYGLDLDQRFRELPYIAQVQT